MSDNIQPDGSWRDPNAQMAIDIGQGKVNPSMAGYTAVQAAHQMYGSAHVNGLWGHHGNAPPAPPSSSAWGYGAGSGSWPSAAQQRAPSSWPSSAAHAGAGGWGAHAGPAPSSSPAKPAGPLRWLVRLVLLGLAAGAAWAAVVDPVSTTLVAGQFTPGLRYTVLHGIDPVRFPRLLGAGAQGFDAWAQAPRYLVVARDGARMHLLVQARGRTVAVATDGHLSAGRLVRGRPVVAVGRTWISVPVTTAARQQAVAYLPANDLQQVGKASASR